MKYRPEANERLYRTVVVGAPNREDEPEGEQDSADDAHHPKQQQFAADVGQ